MFPHVYSQLMINSPNVSLITTTKFGLYEMEHRKKLRKHEIMIGINEKTACGNI